MATDRLVDQYERDGANEGSLCMVAAEITELSGAGIALSPNKVDMTSMGASDEASTRLMDLEITLREGPCNDACGGEDAVEDTDLVNSDTLRLLHAPGDRDWGPSSFWFPGTDRGGSVGGTEPLP